MASDIYFDVETELEGEGRLLERPTFVTKAQPFSEEELRAFVASGEHGETD